MYNVVNKRSKYTCSLLSLIYMLVVALKHLLHNNSPTTY